MFWRGLEEVSFFRNHSLSLVHLLIHSELVHYSFLHSLLDSLLYFFLQSEFQSLLYSSLCSLLDSILHFFLHSFLHLFLRSIILAGVKDAQGSPGVGDHDQHNDTVPARVQRRAPPRCPLRPLHYQDAARGL